MKNLKITLSFVFLVMNFVSAQTINQGKVTYKASLTMDKEDYERIKKITKNKTTDKVKNEVMSNLLNSKELFYVLSFNNEESLFSMKEEMENESERSFNTVEVLGGNGLYYTNSKTMEVLSKRNALGETFLVSENKIEWSLKNEKKTIGNYNCYKATANITYENSSGKSTKEITAWYTPDIPVSFGPKNYSGLPGLILELTRGMFSFKASEIDLSSGQEINIKKPKGGKEVKAEELNQIAKKMNEKRKNN